MQGTALPEGPTNRRHSYDSYSNAPGSKAMCSTGEFYKVDKFTNTPSEAFTRNSFVNKELLITMTGTGMIAPVCRQVTPAEPPAHRDMEPRSTAAQGSKAMSERIAQTLKKNAWIWLVAAFSILVAIGIATS